MKLPAKIRYATRMLIYLAGHPLTQRVSLRQIEADQGISAKFAKQIMQPLERAGLVRSTRGASGGYALGRAPETISLADIFAAFEESIALSPCSGTDPEGCTRHHAGCPAASTWNQLNTLLLTHTRSTTLKSLLPPSPQDQQASDAPGEDTP